VRGALLRCYRKRHGFAGVVVGGFLAMDLAFKCLILPAYLNVLGVEAARTSTALGRVAHVLVPVAGAWLLVLLSLVLRIQRRLMRAPDARANVAEIQRDGSLLNRLPQQLAFAWHAEWVVLFAVLFWSEPVLSTPAAWFFLGAMALGPLPLAHGLGVILVSPLVREVSLAATARGVVILTPPLQLRWRLAFYALCLCMAPTLYVCSVVFLAPFYSTYQLLTALGIFLAGCVLFALLCAAMLATTITNPVAEMASVIRAIIEQGDVSQVGRIPAFERDEIGTLAELTNGMIDRLEATAAERAAAMASLETLNQSLERRVNERTAELSHRNADMRLVLDNVEQGLFTIGPSGQLGSEFSAILKDWFGEPAPGEPFHDYLARSSPAFGAQLRLSWEQVVEGLLPLDVAVDQMPKRLVYAGRHYAFSYQRLDQEEANRFLIVISDMTNEVERASVQREKKETLALFERMLSDRRVVVDFVEEASELVERAAAADQRKLEQLKHALHTLKGNASLFGLESLAELCDDLESRLAECGHDELVIKSAVARLVERWLRIKADVGRLLGEGRSRVSIELTLGEHAELEQAIRARSPYDVLARRVLELRFEPVGQRLRYFAEQASRIGDRLDKSIVTHVSDDGVRVDGQRWSRFWSAFVHLVRNAVDHGIESPHERLAASKSRTGQIAFRAARGAETFTIEVADDGAGIRWDALRARCEARGLVVTRREDLVTALFADGVSTAAGPSELSGRGVGMGALQAAVSALGGKITVWSEAGQGTRISMTFPAQARAPELEPLVTRAANLP